jgi:RHS repeat-associated protein
MREYAWGSRRKGGIGSLLHLRQDGQDYSYAYDGRGNVVMMVDASQQTVASYSYDAFGTHVSAVGSFDQPFRFSTKAYEGRTGFSVFGYRWHAAHLGRWLTRDPLHERPDINLYAFVKNSPLNYLDPSGLESAGGGCDRGPIVPGDNERGPMFPPQGPWF